MAFMDDSDDDDDDEDFKFSRPGSTAVAAAKPKLVAAPPKTAPVQNKPAAAKGGNKAGQKKSLFDSDSEDDY